MGKQVIPAIITDLQREITLCRSNSDRYMIIIGERRGGISIPAQL